MGLWSDEEVLDALKSCHLEIEGWMEENMAKVEASSRGSDRCHGHLSTPGPGGRRPLNPGNDSETFEVAY